MLEEGRKEGATAPSCAALLLRVADVFFFSALSLPPPYPPLLQKKRNIPSAFKRREPCYASQRWTRCRFFLLLKLLGRRKKVARL